MKTKDWNEIRTQFVENGLTYTEIAEKYALSYGTVQHRGRNEDWIAQRNEFLRGGGTTRLERVTDKLLRRIEKTLDDDSSLDVKDFKTVTGALKELRELQRPMETGSDAGGGGVLRVRFVGETEEMSL